MLVKGWRIWVGYYLPKGTIALLLHLIHFRALVCLLLILISSPASLGQNSSHKITKESAIARARTFCQQIGEPASLLATATYSADPNQTADFTQYYGPVWNITFSNGTTVGVLGEDGIICDYSNDTIDQHFSERQEKAGKFLTEAEAKERAASIRHWIGLTGELRYSDATLAKNNDGSKAGDSDWMIYYDRVAFGIPYLQQGMLISIESETGQLKGLSLNFNSSAATSSHARLSKSRAMVLAKAYLKRIPGSRILSHEATLVYVAFDKKRPTLAWQIYFEFTDNQDTLLVNDQTGKVTLD